MKERKEKPADADVVLSDDTEDKRYERHYYRNLILYSIATFLIGSILHAFCDTFGLGGLILGILLVALTIAATLLAHDILSR